MEYVVPFSQLGLDDVSRVGGKNASLGEMIRQLNSRGIRVPGGFATTADAYRDFLRQNGLGRKIEDELDHLNVDNVTALAKSGNKIRQ